MKTIIKAVTGMPVRVPLLVLLLLLATGAGGGLAADRPLTLSEAVALALKNNHELKAHTHSLSARQEEIGVARSLLLPKISLEERYLRTTNPAYAFMTKLNQRRIGAADFIPDSLNRPEAVNDFQTAISIEQPLFIKKANIGLEMSKTEAAASDEGLQRKKEEIAFKVLQAYLMVGTAGTYIRVTEKGLEEAKEHQRLADLRYREGLGLYSDTLRAATAVAEAAQKRISAIKNLGVAKRQLGLVIGAAEAVDTVQETPALPVRALEDYRMQSLARRDLKAMELRTENANSHIKLAEAGYFPSLGLGGSYLLNDHTTPLGSEGNSWQLMAFLKWELFDGAKRGHEKTKAKYQAAEAAEYLAGMKKMVSFQVEEAWLILEEATKNLELAQAAEKTAEEGSRLVRVRYEGSLSPLVDLLDAQVSFDYARANLVARENEYKLAIANLCYAGGTILKDLRVE